MQDLIDKAPGWATHVMYLKTEPHVTYYFMSESKMENSSGTNLEYEQPLERFYSGWSRQYTTVEIVRTLENE